jgi:hypothetical protein
MPLEDVDIDVRLRISTHTDSLPLNSDDLARIIAESLNKQYATPGEVFEVVGVDVEGEPSWEGSDT